MHPLIRRSTTLALLLAATFSASAATLSLHASASQVGLGESFSVDVWVADLAAGQSIGSFDLQLDFDPTLFKLQGYALGTELGRLGAFEAMDLSAGPSADGRSIKLAEVSLLDDLSTQTQPVFTLASLSFKAQAGGEGLFKISALTLGDAWGTALAANTLATQVSAVPEPHSDALLMVGLLGLAASRRRRSGAAQG